MGFHGHRERKAKRKLNGVFRRSPHREKMAEAVPLGSMRCISSALFLSVIPGFFSAIFSSNRLLLGEGDDKYCYLCAFPFFVCMFIIFSASPCERLFIDLAFFLLFLSESGPRRNKCSHCSSSLSSILFLFRSLSALCLLTERLDGLSFDRMSGTSACARESAVRPPGKLFDGEICRHQRARDDWSAEQRNLAGHSWRTKLPGFCLSFLLRVR